MFRVQGVIRMRWGDRALTCGDPRTPPEPEGGAAPCRGGPRSRPSGQDIIRLAIGPVWQRLGHLRYGRFPHRFPTRVAEDDLGGASGCDRDRSRRRARPRARSGGADERVSPMDGRLPGGRCSPHGGAHRPWPLVTLRGHGARLARPSPSLGGRDGLVGTQAGTPTSGGATPGLAVFAGSPHDRLSALGWQRSHRGVRRSQHAPRLPIGGVRDRPPTNTLASPAAVASDK